MVCLDAACTETVPTIDGEIPAGVTPIEVEFGRAAVARSPDKVTEKALTDALTKLTADGVVLSTDTAGRISYTVDGVTSTIDSPLEKSLEAEPEEERRAASASIEEATTYLKGIASRIEGKGIRTRIEDGAGYPHSAILAMADLFATQIRLRATLTGGQIVDVTRNVTIRHSGRLGSPNVNTNPTLGEFEIVVIPRPDADWDVVER